MITNLTENIKKVMLVGIGAMATTAEKSKEIVDDLVKKGELTVEQGKTLNEELKHNLKEKFSSVVPATASEKEEVKCDDIISGMDNMTADELEAIKAKLAELEKAE